MTTIPVTDLRPGDRVRCYDSWNGTVVRVARNFLGPFVVVDYDHDQGKTVVFPPHVRRLEAR